MKDVQPYIFSAKPPNASVEASFLHPPMKRFAKDVAEHIEELCGKKTEIARGDEISQPWSDYCADLSNPASMTSAYCPKLGSEIMLRLDDDLVAVLLDSYYGGEGVKTERSSAALRPSEQRFLAKLSRSVFLHFYASIGWDETPFNEVKLCEVDPEHPAFPATDNEVFCQSFDVNLGAASKNPDAYKFVLLLPADTLAGLADLHGSISPRPEPEIDSGWQKRWSNILNNIHLPMRAIVGHGSINLPDLFELKVGDILPVIPQTRPSLLVGNRKIAVGELGEKDGRAAYKIQTITTQ